MRRKEGRKMTLIGGKEIGTCKMITRKRLQRVSKNKWCQLTQLFSIVAVDEGPNRVMYRELLVEFRDLFAEPTTLPPTRALDHSINLKPNIEPINIRSYRYSLI